MIEVEIRYFASLRANTGVERERLQVTDGDARNLYAQLKSRYRWTLDVNAIRLAINGQIVSWERVLEQGDEVVFLPPFSGG